MEVNTTIMKKKNKITTVSLDDVTLDDIYNFMEHGDMQKAPEHIRDYVLLLDKVRGMYKRIDRYGNPDAIIKHLVTIEGLDRMTAKRIYNEALEYFYCDNTISKAAWKNIYAEKMDMMINFAMLIAKDVNDAQKVVNMSKQAAEVRETHKEDKEELPDELFLPPVKVYTADAESLGLPKVNRNKLKEFVENMPELTEKEKVRLLSEAGITPFKLFLNEQEDPRQS